MFPTTDPAGVLLDSLAFLPEVLLCAGIVVLLLVRLFRPLDRLHLSGLALLFTLGALCISAVQWLAPWLKAHGHTYLLGLPAPQDSEQPFLYSGLLVFDTFTSFLRCFLLLFTALIIWLTSLTGIPDREDSADFYCLLLGATLGMCIMSEANHLLMVYLGVEMASLPSYALAGFLKGRRASSEAALKYVVYGGGAAGVMLFGISLLAGRFGTGYLPDLAVGFSRAAGEGNLLYDPVLVIGTLFLLIGIAFKLAAVPFQFWCPDVFEGASAEVAGYLSVASKGAALALLARVVLMLSGTDPLVGRIGAFPWMDIVRYLVPALAFFAALTATFGNLAAYLQTNLKRLLAYSTIAHAGYMMMGLAPVNHAGVEAVLFYLVAYLFMNLGAFAVVAFLRNETGSEDLDDFRGLVRRSPWMVVTLAFFLLSLLGLPPLVGFVAKFQIFFVLFESGRNYYAAGDPGLGALMYALLVIGGINSVISAFYYLKVLKVMILERRAEDLEGVEPVPLRERASVRLFAGLVTLAVLVLGILWTPVNDVSRSGAARFRRGTPEEAAAAAAAARSAPAGNQPRRAPGGKS